MSAPLLELENVNAYYGKSHALQDVSLSVQPGEVAALLGRNGSGRSTTLKAIMGLVDVKSGSIRFQGKSLGHRAPFEHAKLGIAYVPEDRRIFPNLTVGENLRLAARGRPGPWTEKRIYEYFAVLGERRDKPETEGLLALRVALGGEDLADRGEVGAVDIVRVVAYVALDRVRGGL